METKFRAKRDAKGHVAPTLAWSLTLAVVVFAIASSTGAASAPAAKAGPKAKLTVLAEYKVPGLEAELAGIHPHPTDDALYYVAANKKPAYAKGQRPMLPTRYRGKLLTVNRHTGAIVEAFDLVDGDYGGIAYGEGHIFVSSLAPPEILKVNPRDGKIVARLPASGPIGALEYDNDNSVLLAQLYMGFPHLAVIDPKTGATRETLWSEESAMDLAKVDGDLLCTWTSGYDKHAFSDLLILDRSTGKPRGRVPLQGIHWSMAPLDKKVAGDSGFISLVTTNKATGRVTVRRYAYAANAVAWVKAN